MKTLITGGAGFIGLHLAEKLSMEGYEVVILDNKKPKWKIPNRIKFIKGDVRDIELVKRVCKDVDYIFHKAAIISVVESIKRWKDVIDVNLIGTVNILESALKNDVEKVIFASSSAVYGDTQPLPQKEILPPNPKSPYGISKLSGEYFMKMFYEEYGLKTTSLRYFNVYGPRQDHAVIPVFIKRALSNQPLIIYGDGSQMRDFIFVEDVIRANELVMERGDGEVYNVGSGKAISIEDLAKKIIKLTQSKSRIVHVERREGDIRYSCADISKIKKLGFEPKVDLEKGLSITIEWFKNCLGVER